ncbi:hypothetical protein BH09ACT8_BH09ACT8_55670 [soil metagenome]
MSSFVITAVQWGAPGLADQLPATGYTVHVLTDPHGAPAFHAVLQTPMRFYFDGHFDGSRIDADRFGQDAQGPFLWVAEVIISPHRPEEQPHPGMTNFPMNLDAVLVPVGDDVEALRDNTATMGHVLVDDIAEAPTDTGDDIVVDGDGPTQPEPLTPPIAPPAQSAGPPPLPVSVPASNGALLEGQVQQRVSQLRAQIAALVGWPVAEVQEPKCVKAGKETKQGGPAYSVSRQGYRYFTKDLWQGYLMRETTDPDELLYWIADDVTRSAAWEWTMRTPAFGTAKGAEAQLAITMPLWHVLMSGLRYDWGRRTRLTASEQRRATTNQTR